MASVLDELAVIYSTPEPPTVLSGKKMAPTSCPELDVFFGFIETKKRLLSEAGTCPRDEANEISCLDHVDSTDVSCPKLVLDESFFEERKGLERRSLSDFELRCSVGSGVTGTVFKAFDKKMNRWVALKRIDYHGGPNGLNLTTSTEVGILSSPVGDHENVMKLTGIVEPAGVTSPLFLVLELAQFDLHKLILEKQSLVEEECKEVLYGVLLGLQHLHENGVIHRDLKPSNILVSKSLAVKVCDFSHSRHICRVEKVIPTSQSSNKTRLSHGVVTAPYRSPEILNLQHYDTGVDIWSLGCIFAEMLTGVPLFAYHDVSSDAMEHLAAIHLLLCDPPAVTKRAKNQNHLHRGSTGSCSLESRMQGFVSPDGLRVMRWMMTIDARDRPSAKQLLKDPFFGSVVSRRH
jgi:serine/threonine protein kinase